MVNDNKANAYREPMLEVEPDDEIDLSRWIEAFTRHRRLFVTVVGAIVAIAILLYVITPRSYRASTTIQIERQKQTIISMEDVLGVDNYWDAQSFYPTQYQLLESRGLAERVVQILGLADDDVFNPKRSGLFGGPTQDEDAPIDDQRRMGDLARKLLDNLSIKPVRNTRLVEIAYVAADPELAARVANGMAQAYIDWGIENRTATVGQASSFLSSQIEELKQEIQDKENQLQAYSRSSDIVALDPNSNVVLQRLEALNKDYTNAVSARIEAEAHYHEVVNAPKETVADTFSEGLVAQMRREVLLLEQEYATKLNTYKPEWPAMQELSAKIDKGRENLQSVIDEMVEEARKSASTDYQTALRREQSLTEELTRQKSDAMALNSAAVEYNNLRVEVSTRRTLLDELLRKQSETGVANRLQGTGSSNVVIVDRALVPNGPYRPSLPRNLALGLVLGLMLGFGSVIAKELLDRTLRSPDDVERVLGLPVLGVIPDIGSEGYGYSQGYGYGYGAKGRKPRPKTKPKLAEGQRPITVELLPHEHPRLAVAEAYRTIRTGILLSRAGGLHSVVITSAIPGEGKTSLAANLAIVLAQLGKKTLLIDADMRKPRQHELFKVSNRRGLVHLLTADEALDTLICETEVPQLSLIPAGPAPPNPSELLSSERMSTLMATLKTRFDFIVFDSPPCLAVTDAAVLATLSDGVILTVAAGKVSREDAQSATERMQVTDTPILGVALNLFRAQEKGYKGYQYHGYEAYGDTPEDTEDEN